MSAAAERPGWPFSFDDEIRYGDLDAQRHLNNVAFMVFFESARIAFIRDLFPGHDPGSPDPGKHEGGIEDFGLIFAEAHINYRAPGFYGDTIRTWIRPAHVKRSSFRVEFEMCRSPMATCWPRAGARLSASTTPPARRCRCQTACATDSRKSLQTALDSLRRDG